MTAPSRQAFLAMGLFLLSVAACSDAAVDRASFMDCDAESGCVGCETPAVQCACEAHRYGMDSEDCLNGGVEPPSAVGGGGPVGTGGNAAGTGGGPVGAGGAPGGTGGVPVGTGGAPTGTGGVPMGTGGTSKGTGGAPMGTGGAPTPPVNGPVVPEVPSFPIDVAPNEQWTWVPLEGTKCADGTQAGVGVNFTTKSRDLLIWFQGNGVCYDLVSCTAFTGLLTGMGPDPLNHMWWGDPNTSRIGVFNRIDPGNPWRDANHIVFPHCGVDGHSADKVSTYPPLPPVHQHGYRNVTLALPRILASFADATRVTVAGFSAGGIGAAANYHQIAIALEALGQGPPFLIVDGGPVLPPPFAGPRATSALRDGWGTQNTVEKWCSTCGTEGFHTAYRELARLHPGLRSSIVCSYQDNVATPLYALLNLDPTFTGTRFEAGLRSLSDFTASYQGTMGTSQHREFYYFGDRHGAIAVDDIWRTPGLLEFLYAQIEFNPGWSTVRP